MGGEIRMIIKRAFTFSHNTSRLPSTLGATISTAIDGVAHGSNIQCRGKSNAASVPSDVPEVNKGQKRLSKAERQAKVESFVNNYRAMNGGKFPSITDTRKQLGGSHYVLRQIIQELEYKSKLSPLDSESEQLSVKRLTEENESLTEVENQSGNRLTARLEIHVSNELETGIDSIKNLEELQSSVSAEKSLPKELVQPSIEDDHSGFLATNNVVLGEEAKLVSDSILGKTEDDKKMEARGDSGFAASEENVLEVETEALPSFEKTEEVHIRNSEDVEYKLEMPVSKVLLDVEVTKEKDEPKPGKYSMDTRRRQSDAEVANKSSLWGNLKSFADSIISIWRK